MHRSRLVLTAVALLVVCVPPARSADAPVEPLVEKVRKAIKDGANYLKQQQKADGNWQFRTQRASKGGGAALAVLALLTAGEPLNDPKVRLGVEFVRRWEPSETYTVSLQTMVLAMAGQPDDLKLIQRNVNWLQEARTAKGWSYTSRSGADNSNTQYALLALHEARLAGAKVDNAALKEMRDLFIQTQDARGGWGYQPVKGDAARMTMTTAGLCNLLITGMDLEVGKQKLNADGSADHCGEYDENIPAANAMRWITAQLDLGGRLTPENYRSVFAPHALYGMYGLERAGRLTGQRFLGDHDWYREGCLLLVDLQHRDGYWEDTANLQFGGEPLVATSFALLFLAKGRTPVLISKLAHNGLNSLDWNRKRNDLHHLVDFCSRELFKRQPMAWQVFDIRRKEAPNQDAVRDLAAELLQSPIVFFNGHDLAPRDKEEAVLKEYVNNGGFILAEACCGSPNFDADFRKLVERMFGKGSLQKLPPTHAVWRASGKFEVDPNEFPLWGVSQGCKTVLIYSPKPIAGYWEGDLNKEGRGKIAFELGANIVAYATGLTPPKPRLTEMTVARDTPPDAIKRGFFKVAQLERNEAAPAPRAMRNLMEEVRKAGLDVILETRTIAPESDTMKYYWFYYMHGREAFKLDDVGLKNLRFRLEHGATLLADACCGSKAYDESFRKMVADMWPKQELKLEPIPPNDELYSRELNGEPIEAVRCRRPGPDGGRGRPEFQVLPPELEGVKYKGRWVVIYSKYDLGCALEKAPSPECIGHDYDSAVRLGRAAVLYALKR
jgi:hypothetical protein